MPFNGAAYKREQRKPVTSQRPMNLEAHQQERIERTAARKTIAVRHLSRRHGLYYVSSAQ